MALIIQDRNGIIENRHRIHVAVVDSSGKVLQSLGDPFLAMFPRSTIKPAQALAILLSGAFPKFDFDEQDLALMCASHSSEAQHIDRGRALLSKLGLSEDRLHCGGHESLSPHVNQEWARRDFSPTAICNDCSGKHIGMLASALAVDLPIENYHSPDHPLQKHVREVLEQTMGLEMDKTQWATDGCNLPAPFIPLDRLGFLYAQLAEAASGQGGSSTSMKRSSNQMPDLARIFFAMSTYPELIGGTGRFDTELMRLFKGRLIAKVGADGAYAIGIRAGTQIHGQAGRTIEEPLGISFKIEDGDFDMLYLGVSEVLHQLGVGDELQRQTLESWRMRQRRSTTGALIGRAYLSERLRTV